ncbi:hypothetical protein P3102_15230 [Amycolatopsis sp. QT-25]|uniref:hypothetical protein n=1 Tax=Amycolatopsis sp. QT-25 TaxID=3034022 RepID=UPI0023ECDDD0|nr:hypothetical protein [Amycolatopsis sp. QT-25]WET82459.1 hypothetical protein P3102_15230 [Amycolatopsis sp. QT-25]
MTRDRAAGARTRKRRALLREPDGTLFDIETNRVVDLVELLDEVKAGRRFRAHRRNGADCTVEVLVQMFDDALTGQHAGLPAPGLLALLAPRPPARPAPVARPGDTVVPLHPVEGPTGTAGCG